jgi:aminopeptidase-like protein
LNSDIPKNSAPLKEIGLEAYTLIAELFPICRSITGEGFRQTMDILRQHIPLQLHEVSSGTKVFDWEVPREWNIKDAYVKDSKGEKVIDFQRSNLHVLNYSVPVNKVVSLTELKEHLFTLPNYPDWIPYKTSYYKDNWGFCLSHNDLLQLEEGEYEVFVDSTLENGNLTYGEVFLEGESQEEVLISCHCCHPSLANDNLSGISLAVHLAKHFLSIPHRLSYRFVFIPGTIGAITWLSLNEPNLRRIKHGLVITGVGDPGKITYKRSRRGDAEIDRVASYVLQNSGMDHDIIDFYPYGYDERQYCSPAFNLPVGCMARTPYGQYPEYHTSADNLEFINPAMLEDSFSTLLKITNILESNRTYMNLSPKCEPQLGKRGLYSSIGAIELALLWVLNMSDGDNSLLDIAQRSGIKFDSIESAAKLLLDANLITPYQEQIA